MRLLITQGSITNEAKCNQYESRHGVSRFMCELRSLVNLGVDLNGVDRYGRTAFHILCNTCTFGKYTCCVGVETEADEYKVSQSNLEKVAYFDRNDAIKYLVECGCDVTLRDANGMTGWDLALRHKECFDEALLRPHSGWNKQLDGCLTNVLEQLAVDNPDNSGLCEEYRRHIPNSHNGHTIDYFFRSKAFRGRFRPGSVKYSVGTKAW